MSFLNSFSAYNVLPASLENMGFGMIFVERERERERFTLDTLSPKAGVSCFFVRDIFLKNFYDRMIVFWQFCGFLCYYFIKIKMPMNKEKRE